MTINVTHWGNDPMGASTLHKGLRDDCPAPECPDPIRVPDTWGTYCPHGKRIVERDPDRTDCEGYPVGRNVDPWPCHEGECTREAFERACQAEEDEYWDSLMSEVKQW